MALAASSQAPPITQHLYTAEVMTPLGRGYKMGTGAPHDAAPGRTVKGTFCPTED